MLNVSVYMEVCIQNFFILQNEWLYKHNQFYLI